MHDHLSRTPRLIELACEAAPGLAASPGDPISANLSEAGLTSIAAVRLMLALEAEFDIAIPDAELTPENFATVADISRLVDRLTTHKAA